ncbi:MAG: zinc metallopeptidase, partial [Clostridia bacterium]
MVSYMFGGFFYFDPWYFLLIIPAMIIGLIAQAKVKSTFNKYSGVLSKKNITGANAAREILNANGLSSIQIEKVNGKLTD